MRKQAKPYPASPRHCLCPFCDTVCTNPEWNSFTWCTGCYVEYYRTRSGTIIFDTNRRTPRFAWAKALAKSGGVSLKLPSNMNEEEEATDDGQG